MMKQFVTMYITRMIVLMMATVSASPLCGDALSPIALHQIRHIMKKGAVAP